MKALLQRVTQAAVEVDFECVGRIEKGLLVFVGFEKGDDRVLADKMLDKLLAYRIFADDEARMNRSVVEVEGGVLLVSQFTLSADTQKGLRPSFSGALAPADALILYDYMLRELRSRHGDVAAGEFGAGMSVSLTNDGPVTFLLDMRNSVFNVRLTQRDESQPFVKQR
ncbi:MAG: D-tyrosyl-tRNA(Tyr) deacylase [Halioglobus sp.]